jgi:hypothetical protein
MAKVRCPGPGMIGCSETIDTVADIGPRSGKPTCWKCQTVVEDTPTPDSMTPEFDRVLQATYPWCLVDRCHCDEKNCDLCAAGEHKWDPAPGCPHLPRTVKGYIAGSAKP